MHEARHLAGAGLIAFAGLTAAPGAEATYFTFLTDDSLVGRATVDGFLGNGDDTFLPGLNNVGAASQFADSLGNFGFLYGYMATQGLTMVGPQYRHVFGANEHTFINMYGEWNSYFLNSFNNGFTQTLNSGTPSQITINEDQTYTTSFVLDDDGFGGRIHLTGSGEYLLAGQDASSLYAGDLLTHFDFVTPLLPDGWTGVAHEVQTYEVLDGDYAGTTGVNTLTFYTFDAPPEPPPVPLGAPWQTSGTVAISANGSNITLLGVAGAGGDAVAILAAGAMAEVGNFVLIGEGNASLAVEGAGTQALRAPGTDGFVSLATAGEAAVAVRDGARLEATVAFIQQGGSAATDIEVSGTGSVLDLACNTTVCGIAGIVDFSVLVGGTGTSTTNVTAGGRIDVGADNNAFAVVNLLGNHVFTVNGADSALNITGSQNGTAPALQSGIGIEQTSVLNILDGAAVSVTAANVGLTGVGLGFQAENDPTKAAALLLVDGTGSTLTTPVLTIGELVSFDPTLNQFVEAGPGATSLVTIRNGGTVVAERILIGAAGTLMGNGGTLIGAVENHGTIAPGESPGTLTIDGDFVQGADGVLVIEIGGAGPGEYDVLHVTGTATLGGTLKLELLNGFVPGAGSHFDFLTAGLFAGDFAFYDLPSIGGQPVFTLAFGPDGLRATVVPLPGAAWLFGSAALALVARRRTRSRSAA